MANDNVRGQPSRGYGNLPWYHSYTATVHSSTMWAGCRSSARCPSRPCQCRTLCRPINAWYRYLAHRAHDASRPRRPMTIPRITYPRTRRVNWMGHARAGAALMSTRWTSPRQGGTMRLARHVYYQGGAAVHPSPPKPPLSRGLQQPIVGCRPVLCRVSSRALRCGGGAPRSGSGGG